MNTNKIPEAISSNTTIDQSSYRITALLCVAATSFLAVACGAAQEDDLSFEEQVAQTEELESYLNSDEATCGEASADKTYTGMFSTFTTPATYSAGKNGCGGSYFVDVNDYKTSAGASSHYNRVLWGDTVPTTQAACQAATLNVYVFEKHADGSATFVHNETKTGAWDPGFTFPPGSMCGDSPCIGQPATCSIGMNIDHNGNTPGLFSLVTGRDYKFAMRARDMTTPTSPVYKKLKVTTGTIPVIN